MDVKWGDLKWQGPDAPKNWQLMFRHWKLVHIALRIQASCIEITAIVLLVAKIHSANHKINYPEMGPGLKPACHIALVGTGFECYWYNPSKDSSISFSFGTYILSTENHNHFSDSVNHQNLAVLLFVDHETGNLLLPETVDFMAISCNFWGQERGDGGMGFFPGVQRTKGNKVVLPWRKWGTGCSQPILVWNQEAFWAHNCLCVAPCCIMLYYRA